MATIWERGPYQYCARIRRKVVSKTKTFESRREAEEWSRIMEGKVTGDEFVDRSKAHDTTLSQALDWYARVIVPKTSQLAKVKMCQVAYWKASRFADWSLLSLRPWDLLEWRREVLDEDNAEDVG